jgi:Reversibly glycosylated polypeptide
MKTAIVVPAHIPLTKTFIDNLSKEAINNSAEVIIVDDSDGKLGELPKFWRVYGYDKQKEFLGELYEIFANLFHRCSACRVFGHILAYSEGKEVVIGLDSDCEVREGFIKEHLEMLSGKYSGNGWQNPLETVFEGTDKKWYSRGFPYFMRDWPIVANMGLWENCLDINGKDRSPTEPRVTDYPKYHYDIASAPIPFSGMNFAMKREALPGFMFLPNFDFNQVLSDPKARQWRFRRIDDIWGGYIFQKLVQKRRQSVTYGNPIVDHISEVIAEEDAAEEEAMYKWEEKFIEDIDVVIQNLEGKYNSYQELFKYFFQKFSKGESGVICHKAFNNVIPAMEWWVKVWEKYG